MYTGGGGGDGKWAAFIERLSELGPVHTQTAVSTISRQLKGQLFRSSSGLGPPVFLRDPLTKAKLGGGAGGIETGNLPLIRLVTLPRSKPMPIWVGVESVFCAVYCLDL